MVDARGSQCVPSNHNPFCTAVTVSPDGGAFHITTYGGSSLLDQRSYENGYLSCQSFMWINASDLTQETNMEQHVNSTIGHDAITGACQTYRGSQMIVLEAGYGWGISTY